MGNLAEGYVNLPRIMADYGLKAVVETGTGYGGSMLAVRALDPPALYMGCETDEAAVRHCKSEWPAAIIAHQDSLAFLKQILQPHTATNGGAVIPGWTLPTLWHLDAHSFEGENGFPLLREMEIVAALKDGIENDVILCDDIRVIADEANPRYRPGELGHPYVRDEYAWFEYTNIFSRTHVTQVISDGEGYLAFFPCTKIGER